MSGGVWCIGSYERTHHTPHAYHIHITYISHPPSSLSPRPPSSLSPRPPSSLPPHPLSSRSPQAPFSPGKSNMVFVRLPAPIRIGAFRLWNYSKTPARGVQSFSIHIDGALAFQGPHCSPACSDAPIASPSHPRTRAPRPRLICFLAHPLRSRPHALPGSLRLAPARVSGTSAPSSDFVQTVPPPRRPPPPPSPPTSTTTTTTHTAAPLQRAPNVICLCSDRTRRAQVLFTDTESIIVAERDHVYNKSDLEEGLVIFDNGQRLTVRQRLEQLL